MIRTTITYEQYLERMEKLRKKLENGVVRNETYELLDESERLWNIIKSYLLRAANDKALARTNLAEIHRNGKKSVILYVNKTQCKEVRSIKIKENLSFYSMMLRVALLAEPYGLKVIHVGSAIEDEERWIIEYLNLR